MKIEGLPPTMADHWLEYLTKFYLLPGGKFLAIWDAFIVCVAVLNTVMLTFMASFQVHSPGAWVLSYAIDIIFLTDIYIKFHRAFLSNGFWVVFPKEMALRYLDSVEFWLDLASSLPVDLFALCFFATNQDPISYLALVRLPKLIRVRCIVAYFMREEQRLHAGFMLHSSGPDGPICSDNSWVNSRTFTATNDSLFSLYVDSIYWATTTLTTTGYGDIHPDNTGERIMACFVQIMGILFFGYISGTIASSLSNMDSRRVTYQQKMDAVVQYMRTRDMDYEMQQRVLEYFDYAWNRNKGIDVRHLFDEMPATFRGDLLYSLNFAIIDQAKVFSACSLGFRRTVAYTIKFYLYTADEFLTHQGDLAQEMYFITQGRIDIFDGPEQKRAIKCLIEGSCLGYAPTILGGFHDYSARAVCNSDVFVLTRDEIEGIFRAYPEDAKLVRQACMQIAAETSNKKMKTCLSDEASSVHLSTKDSVAAGLDKVPSTQAKSYGSQGFLIMESEAQAAKDSGSGGIRNRRASYRKFPFSSGAPGGEHHESDKDLNSNSHVDGKPRTSTGILVAEGSSNGDVSRRIPNPKRSHHGSADSDNGVAGLAALPAHIKISIDPHTESQHTSSSSSYDHAPPHQPISTLQQHGGSAGLSAHSGLQPPILEADETSRSKLALAPANVHHE
ncbi:hypothetical protein SmJEL517_g00458 [Synchytrium microbalum]|uniref:Cyclic nucleotide-binding domain-containing protein n=1 Tax=Synchytrium microbalum TaxID=1806994 RepID=A0A507CHN5_9FUNG|nr:uncharacterized protein SmJEL517_g00458 [Synchytrium microbalum]TPX37564.1 hypothetical protein SmJEL517_g00458 [Synchytrium microbalum]